MNERDRIDGEKYKIRNKYSIAIAIQNEVSEAMPIKKIRNTKKKMHVRAKNRK